MANEAKWNPAKWMLTCLNAVLPQPAADLSRYIMKIYWIIWIMTFGFSVRYFSSSRSIFQSITLQLPNNPSNNDVCSQEKNVYSNFMELCVRALYVRERVSEKSFFFLPSTREHSSDAYNVCWTLPFWGCSMLKDVHSEWRKANEGLREALSLSARINEWYLVRRYPHISHLASSFDISIACVSNEGEKLAFFGWNGEIGKKAERYRNDENIESASAKCSKKSLHAQTLTMIEFEIQINFFSPSQLYFFHFVELSFYPASISGALARARGKQKFFHFNSSQLSRDWVPSVCGSVTE